MRISLGVGNPIELLQNRLLARVSFLDALKEVSSSKLGDRVLVPVANIEQKYKGNRERAANK